MSACAAGKADFHNWGVLMRLALKALLLFPIGFLLAACSGVSGGGCVSNCGGSGSIAVILSATPPAPSAGLSVQAFTATITGLTLTPSGGGSAVSINLNSTAYIAEFTRVTSDSTLLAGKITVPSGTYRQAAITFAAPKITFCTQSNPGVPGCAGATLASLIGTPGSVTISTNLTVADNALTGIALNINLGNALTVTGQTVTALDLAATNTFSATTLPSASNNLASGQIARLDDVLGLVTGATSTSITIQTSTRGSITAATNSSTRYNCAAQNSSCVQTNQVAVMDAILHSDGSITATFFQPIIDSGDLIEGLVTSVPSTVTNQFTLVATDSAFAPSNSVLNGSLNIGDQVIVTLAGTVQPFVIVDKGLGNPTLPGNSFDGSTSITSVQPGMTVLFPVSAYTAQSGTTPGAASTVSFALRFTRITTSIATSTSPDFTVAGSALPPFFGLATNQFVRTNPDRLSIDGAQTVTGIPVSTTISTSALFLNPNGNPAFLAQSIRTH